MRPLQRFSTYRAMSDIKNKSKVFLSQGTIAIHRDEPLKGRLHRSVIISLSLAPLSCFCCVHYFQQGRDSICFQFALHCAYLSDCIAGCALEPSFSQKSMIANHLKYVFLANWTSQYNLCKTYCKKPMGGVGNSAKQFRAPRKTMWYYKGALHAFLWQTHHMLEKNSNKRHKQEVEPVSCVLL